MCFVLSWSAPTHTCNWLLGPPLGHLWGTSKASFVFSPVKPVPVVSDTTASTMPMINHPNSRDIKLFSSPALAVGYSASHPDRGREPGFAHTQGLSRAHSVNCHLFTSVNGFSPHWVTEVKTVVSPFWYHPPISFLHPSITSVPTRSIYCPDSTGTHFFLSTTPASTLFETTINSYVDRCCNKLPTGPPGRPCCKMTTNKETMWAMKSCGRTCPGGGHPDNPEYLYLKNVDYYCEQFRNTFSIPK